MQQSRGFKATANRKTRAGHISSVHKPAMMRSGVRRLGARFRPRFRIRILVSHQDGFGNHGTEPARSTKSDHDADRMQKKSENVAHAEDGIRLRKLKNSGRLRNFATHTSRWPLLHRNSQYCYFGWIRRYLLPPCAGLPLPPFTSASVLCARYLARSLRTTEPPFKTNLTDSRTETLASGSPLTAIRSA